MVARGQNQLLPFDRDSLFTSVHDSCRHRPASVGDASALTQTIIAELLGKQEGGIITRNAITQTVYEVLQRFDAAAATVYAAYHPVPVAATATS
jgi:transcriptional regulator NrdR family protein